MQKSTQEILKQFQIHSTDTGSPEVQIALLTDRITSLTAHFSVHKQDKHSRRGLIQILNKRNKLLAYLNKESKERYMAINQALSLRSKILK